MSSICEAVTDGQSASCFRQSRPVPPLALSALRRVIISSEYRSPSIERRNTSCADHSLHRFPRHNVAATVPINC
jgi:hypothetical protein